MASVGLLHLNLCFEGHRPARDEDLWKLTSQEQPPSVMPGLTDVATYNVDSYIIERRDTKSMKLLGPKLAASNNMEPDKIAESGLRHIHDGNLEPDNVIAGTLEHLAPEYMVTWSVVAIVIPPLSCTLL